MSANAASYQVERSAQIVAPPERVHRLLVDFHRWIEWSPWEDVDPDLRRSYSGSESGVGAVYEWTGNRKAGAGRMEIVGDDPHRVDVQLDFLKPFKSHNSIRFALTPADEGTEVTWTMTGPKTVMTRIVGIFTSMDKMVGPDFEKGLDQLKVAAERPS